MRCALFEPILRPDKSQSRFYTEGVIASGTVSIADLRNGAGEACTLRLGRLHPVPLGPADPALLAALRRLGAIVVRVPIAPEGIAELVRLGWLDIGQRLIVRPTSVADAIVKIANAALDAGLRPDYNIFWDRGTG